MEPNNLSVQTTQTAPLEDELTDQPQTPQEVPKPPSKQPSWNWKWFVLSFALLVIVSAAIFGLIKYRHNKSATPTKTTIKVQDVDLNQIDKPAATLDASASDRVVVNGLLQVNKTILLTPTPQPASTKLGTIYLDEATKQLRYYNGTSYVTVMSSGAEANYLTETEILNLIVGFGPPTILPQDLATTGSPQFTGLTISNLTENGVVTVGVGGVLQSTVAGSSGQCLLSTAGAPTFGACASGSVTSVNGFSGIITIDSNNLSVVGSSNNITIDTTQDLGVSDSPTFAGLTVNGNISQTGASTLSTGTGAITLNGSTTLSSTFTQSGANTFSTGTGTVSLNGPTTVAANQQFTALGNSLFRAMTDSSSAFLVQNSSSSTLFGITTASSQNLISNSLFTSDITGWVGLGSPTPVPTTTEYNDDNSYDISGGSLRTVNNGSSTQGPSYAVSLTAGEDYTLSGYVRGSSVKQTRIYLGYYTSADLSTASDTCNKKDVSTTWTFISCKMNNVPSGITGVYFRSSKSDGDWLLDKVVLQQGIYAPISVGQTYSYSPFSIYTDSDNGFLVQNTTSLFPVLNIDTNTGKSVYHSVNNNQDALQVRNADDVVVFNVYAGESGNLTNWSTQGSGAALPLRLMRFQAASLTNNVGETYAYVIGGQCKNRQSSDPSEVGNCPYSTGTPVDTVYYAKMSGSGSEIWYATGNSGLPRLERHAVVSAKGFVYVIGGLNESDVYQNAVYYNKPNSAGEFTSSWSTTSSLNDVRANIQAVYYNNYIYVIGGGNGSSAYDTVEYARVYPDGTLGAWTKDVVNVLPQSLDQGGVAISKGYLYYLGGVTGGGSVRQELYFTSINSNGSINSWQTAADFGAPTKGMSLHIANDYMYSVGGQNGTNTFSSVYYTKLDSTLTYPSDRVEGWSSTPSNIQDETGTSQKRSVHGGIIYANSKLYVIGGQSGGNANKATVFNADISGTSTAVSVGGSLSVETNATINGQLQVNNSVDSNNALTVRSTFGELLNVSTLYNSVTLGGLNTATINKWATTNELPRSNSGHGSATLNGFAYVTSGGTNVETSYSRIYTDGSLGTWSDTAADLPDYMDGNGTITANGYVYVIGGTDSGGKSANVYFGKPNSSGDITSWTTSAVTLDTAVSNPAVVVANGYIYVIGGVSAADEETIAQYAKLNPDGTLTGTGGQFYVEGTNPLPLARSNAKAVFANGYIYVTAGADNTDAATDTTYYSSVNSNGTLGGWTSSSSVIPETRKQHTSFVANGYLYVVGGRDSTDAATNTVYYAKIEDGGNLSEWNSATLPDGQELFSEVYSHATAVANGYVYVFGGKDISDANTDTVYFGSTARISVGGSLDLVGLGSRTLADAGGGGQLTAGNTTVVGTLDVRDSANFTQSLTIGGTLTTHGSVEVLNSSGYSLFGVNATTGFVKIGESLGAGSATLDSSSLTANRTYNLPDANGEICLSSGNCTGGGAGNSLQDAYDAGNTIDTADATDIDFDLADTSTDSKFTVDIQGTGNTIEFQDSGTPFATFADSGIITLQNTLNSTAALSINNSGGNSLLVVDTSNGEIEFGTNNTLSGKIVFHNASNVNTLTLQSGATGGAVLLTLPVDDGSDGDCLITDGTGVLSFGGCTGGAGGGVTDINSIVGSIILQGTSNQVTVSNNSPVAGTITLSTPQDIATSSDTTFNSLNLGSGNITATGAINVTSTTTSAITLDSGTTGTVNLGTSANAKTINIGTGAAVANTIYVGGTGANNIYLGNTQTAGSIQLGAAMTTGSITIGGTGAQTGNIDIGTGTGAQSINIGTNTGAKTISIGYALNTSTTINGQQTSVAGLSTLSLNSPSTVRIYAGLFSGGTVTIGNYGIGGQTVLIGATGTSTYASTVNIGDTTNSTGTQVISIGSAAKAANSLTLEAGNTGAISVGNSSNAHTINIGSAGTTNVQSVSIGSNGSAAHTLLLQGGNGATAIQMQTAASGTISIGNNAVASTVNIGNSTSTTAVSLLCGTGTCGIGNNATDHSTTVGSTTGTSLLTLKAGSGGISLGTNTTITGNLVPEAASLRDLGSSSAELDELYLGDTNGIKFGLDQDTTLAWDNSDARLELSSSTAGSASLFIEDRLSLGGDPRTIADDGAGTNATLTLNPTSSYVEITCNDANGCDITMGEASAKQGDMLFVVNLSNINVNFADTSGVSELAGTFAAGQYDSIQMIYTSDRWLEVSRSDN